jgi:hypothetical protein
MNLPNEPDWIKELVRHIKPKRTFSAIETSYLGFRFRSRLEARWACLFHELRIEFWYEPEGFRFDDGTQYLPDFYLPQVQFWAEVKPDILTPEELSKCKRLAAESKRNTLLLVGPPDFKTYMACLPFALGEGSESDVCDFLLDIDSHGRKYYNDERRLYGSCAGEFSSEEDFTFQYRDAVHFSRAQRFEEVS